jgi:hypothetical protein
MRFLDSYNGITEHFKTDKMTGDVQIITTQDVDPFFEYNKAQFDNATRNFKGDMHKMASIPTVVIEIWREEMKKAGYDDTNPLSAKNRKFLLSKLNSPDWNKLRTKQGII